MSTYTAPASAFGLHRPEHTESLMRGEAKLSRLVTEPLQAVAAGRILIKADSEHQYVYRLRSGWACRNRVLPDGRDQFILVFVPGDLFAVKSMFIDRHPDNIQILADAEVERIHYQVLHEAFTSDPDVANRCIWQIVEEERRLHSSVVSLGQGSAEERLALLLMDLRGRLVRAGFAHHDALTFDMPLTQVQIADHLGITPVHANRVIRVFREKAIANVRRGSMVVQDMPQLARLANPLMDPYERNSPDYQT